MAKYSFTDRKTDTLVNLGDVEMACREFLGFSETLEESDNLGHVDTLAELGLALLYTQGGHCVTKEHLQNAKSFDKLDELALTFINWAFTEKWLFSAWR